MSPAQLKVLCGCICLAFAYYLMTTLQGFFVSPVTGELGFERGSFTIYTSVMIFFSMLTAPFLGKMIRYFGADHLLLFNSLWCGLGLSVFAFCRKLWQFYIIAALIGPTFANFTMILLVVYINRAFHEHNGKYVGFAMAGCGVAGIVFGHYGNIIRSFGWRNAFVLAGVVWTVVTMTAFLLLRGQLPTEDIVEDNKTKEATPAVYLKRPSLYLLMSGTMIIAIGGTIQNHLPAHFSEQQVPLSTAGTLMATISGMSIVFKVVGGMIFDRLGAKINIFAITSAFIIACFLFTRTEHAALFAGTVFISFGAASVNVFPPLMTRKLFGDRDFIHIWGVENIGLNLGKMIGTPLIGLGYDVTGAYETGFYLYIITILIACGLLLMTLYESRPKGVKCQM